MFWQPYLIRRNDTQDFATTYRLDLPKNGILGSLYVMLSADQAADFSIAGGKWRIVDYIDKIEVIGNGATVIKSVTGQLAHALSFLDQGVLPADVMRGYATNTQMARFLINFGRWFGDNQMGLDLSQWDNVELRITNSATSSQFTTSFSTTTIANMLRQAAGTRPVGYMRTELWRSITAVQNQWNYLELPTDYPIRRVVLQGLPHQDGTTHMADCSFADIFYDIEHYLNTGETEVFVGRGADLALLNYLDFGKDIIQHGHFYANALKGLDVSVGYPLAHVATPGSYSGAAETLVTTLEAGMTRNTIRFEQAVGTGPDEFLVKGYAYMETGVIRYDWDSDPTGWLDPMRNKTVLLNVHNRDSSGVASGTLNVLLDRFVRA